MIRARRTRIVATLGPASRGIEKVTALALAGADVFRLNFSHGTHEDHAAALDCVRRAEGAVDRPLGVLADLQGPKLRLGVFKDGSIAIRPGAKLVLDLDSKTPSDESRVSLPHPELFKAMTAGSLLLLDDGKVRLRVHNVGAGRAEVEVVQGDKLSDRKGVALPGAVIPVDALTPKDREDLEFALHAGVDWVALSFVQKPEDMALLKSLVARRAACLAKIEKPAALERLPEILDLCDGVMVARGDLGVELEPEEVPAAQKQILRCARERGVPAIVATQMLESMITSATPTRAEASDVANAVYEGADALMLSAETASGQFPLEAVGIMNRIAERVERDPRWPELMSAEHDVFESDADILVAAAARAAEAGATGCLAVFSYSGHTARLVARERPLQATIALTPRLNIARQLALVWGLEPRVSAEMRDLEAMTQEAVTIAVRLGLAKPDERVLVLLGFPLGTPGTANVLRLAHAPRG